MAKPPHPGSTDVSFSKTVLGCLFLGNSSGRLLSSCLFLWMLVPEPSSPSSLSFFQPCPLCPCVLPPHPLQCLPPSQTPLLFLPLHCPLLASSTERAISLIKAFRDEGDEYSWDQHRSAGGTQESWGFLVCQTRKFSIHRHSGIL